MANSRKPFIENTPGDFYVENGCCTSCGMPTTVAPGLFSYAQDGHCYVSKQPIHADEVKKMIEAFQVQEVQCIRYKGTDRIIQLRLIHIGEGNQCDHLPPDLSAIYEDQQPG